MRELKFRAWDGKIMHEWGFLEGTFIGPPSNSRGNFQTMKHMQFIGLLNKNGKEIYEGHIIRVKEICWLVEPINSMEKDGRNCGLCVSPGGSGVNYFLDKSLLNGEIIGNIYQHPELLEEVK